MLDKNTHKNKIAHFFEENSLSKYLCDTVLEKLAKLTEIMLCENEKYNLTAIKEPDKIALMHYADCAAIADFIPEGACLADIGCGAGFPTLPLAIVRPDIKILAVDSTAKRVLYVENTARLLGLDNVSTLCARAEELSARGGMRESFDIVTARAVAALPVLAELCLPLTKVSGRFLAMKGKSAAEELSEAERAIKCLGGSKASMHTIKLLGDAEVYERPLIEVTKVKCTPKEYPRSYSQISKKPL